jgi:predicted TIM-barrel fold metal-dependent hydrolase
MIIDSHVHVDEVRPLGWIDPPETILSLMDEAGIDKAVIMTYTDVPGLNDKALEYTAEIVGRFSDRFYGYARMHPWYGKRAIDLFERAVVELGLRGLKLHPVSTIAHPGDDSTLQLIRKAAELGVPVLFHCGDEPLTTPYELEYSVRACPEATIIFGHMGGYFHVSQAIDVAGRHPDVYLDTSAMPHPHWIRRAVDQLGPERVLFASDGPGCDPRLEVYKVNRAGLTPTESELVFGGNILRLLASDHRR